MNVVLICFGAGYYHCAKQVHKKSLSCFFGKLTNRYFHISRIIPCKCHRLYVLS